MNQILDIQKSFFSADLPHLPKSIDQLKGRLEGKGWTWLNTMLELKPTTFIFSGGALFNTLMKVTPSYQNTDVDVFVYDADATKLTKKLETLLTKTLELYPETKMKVAKSSLWLEVDSKQPRYNVTCMLTDEPLDIISNFDLAYVQAFFDGTTLLATNQCHTSWKTKKMVYNLDTDVESEVLKHEAFRLHIGLRIAKATLKGFEVKCPLVLSKTEQDQVTLMLNKSTPHDMWVYENVTDVLDRVHQYDPTDKWVMSTVDGFEPWTAKTRLNKQKKKKQQSELDSERVERQQFKRELEEKSPPRSPLRSLPKSLPKSLLKSNANWKRKLLPRSTNN